MKGKLKILVTGKEQGFTLLELLVALTIMALLTGTVVVTLSSHDRALDSAVNRTLGLLKSCRNNAIISGHKYAVSFKDERSTLFFLTPLKWEIEKTFKQPVGIAYQFSERFRLLSERSPQIECSSDGLNTPFTIMLIMQKQSRCISSAGNGVFGIDTAC